MGLLIHILLRFVARTVGAATRVTPGVSKFRRRRTLDTGVENTISAGRFDITTRTNDRYQIPYEIVSNRIRSVRILHQLTIFDSEHTPQTVNSLRELVQQWIPHFTQNFEGKSFIGDHHTFKL
ncbi:AC6 protein [Hedyotis uncinella yellow mosaic virus]|uniref:AC6 protein n=1 Tax=Hedyotis uncinella yellow mosaic virus TaxID=1428190 RepID=S5RJR1_9GEMI|nr:AC6 protein [Hedyotis uncinella yellow mosaic virus]AGS12480.1 AC6 protein [Hedyotis uncinella yellow mosaic virus]